MSGDATKHMKEVSKQQLAENTKGAAASNGDTLLEQVMDVAVLHHLSQELDPFTLFQMRRTSHLFKRLAVSMASTKMKSAEIFVEPHINGMLETEWHDIEGNNPKTWNRNGKIALLTSNGSTFVPCDDKPAEFDWTSKSLVDKKLSQLNPFDLLLSKEAYLGQKLSLNWEPGPQDGRSLRGRDFELGGPTNFTTDQILVDDMIIHDHSGTLGVHTASKPGVTITYQVIEHDVQNETLPTEVNFGTNLVMLPHVRFSGRVRILKAKVDFAALVASCACMLEEKLENERKDIEKERPLTDLEKAYLDDVLEAKGI